MGEPPGDDRLPFQPPAEPPAGSFGAPDIRVSDADRNQIVDILRSYCADGFLTLDEFSDRVGAVFAARTRSELDTVTADLPRGAPPQPAARRRTPTRSVVAIMTPNNRKGRWRAGEEVAAVAIMGSIQLDLRQAEIDGPELLITAVAIMGGIQIIVPEGIEVDVNSVPIMGGKHVELADVPPIPGAPVIRVRAIPIMGGVHIQSRRTRTPEELAERKRQRDLQRELRRSPGQSAGRDLPAGPAAGHYGHGPGPHRMPGPSPDWQPGAGGWQRVDRKREKIERKMERHRDLADMVGKAAQEARAAIEQARREWERAAREWDREGWTPDPPGSRREPWAGGAASVPQPPPTGQPAPVPEARQTPESPQTPQAARADAGADSPAAESTLNAAYEAAGTPTAPDGTVTILFSDICGSTELNEQLGDLRTQEVLRAHNGIVRGHLSDHDGFEVKTAGDGVMAAFAGASKALRCAADIQRSVEKWRSEHPEEPFAIHIGLHTGETIKEGNDFFGRTVILASRITAQAGESEILVSSLLKELTEWTGEFRFGDMREVTLKGVTLRQKVYPLDWEDAGAA